MAVDAIPSVDDMLANARANAARRGSAGGSAVQRLLAGREESPTANMSAVERVFYEQQQSKPKQASEPYTEQDWFIKAKVRQLKAQIELYSTIPGLDPGGAILGALGKEVTDLVKKQQAAIKKLTDEATAKQEELAKKKAAEFQGLSVEDMLKRTKALVEGTDLPLSAADKAKSDAADALLKKIGAKVNQTA